MQIIKMRPRLNLILIRYRLTRFKNFLLFKQAITKILVLIRLIKCRSNQIWQLEPSKWEKTHLFCNLRISIIKSITCKILSLSSKEIITRNKIWIKMMLLNSSLQDQLRMKINVRMITTTTTISDRLTTSIATTTIYLCPSTSNSEKLMRKSKRKRNLTNLMVTIIKRRSITDRLAISKLERSMNISNS